MKKIAPAIVLILTLAGVQLSAVAGNGASSGRWSLDASVLVISDNDSFQPLYANADSAEGDAGGEIYNIGLAYRLKEFAFEVGDRVYTPHLELRGGISIVDENGRGEFFGYRAELVFWWRDFPWNRHVYTTLGVGGGIAYWDKVLETDRIRHRKEDRSHIKFSVPVELTLSHPEYRSLQFVLMNHHYSGGHLFDKGGFDAFGGGLRYRSSW